MIKGKVASISFVVGKKGSIGNHRSVHPLTLRGKDRIWESSRSSRDTDGTSDEC